MAQRYGGKFSPGGTGDGVARAHPFEGKVPTRMGARVNLLFVLPFFFAVSAFFSEPLGMVYNLAAFGAMMLAAWLTREGIRAEAAFDMRTVARRPAIPRKIFGAVAMGVGMGLAAGWRDGLLSGALLGGLAGVLHLMAFGPDPLKDKGIDRSDHQSSRVAKAVDNAEAELGAMTRAIEKVKDRALTDRVARFQVTARKMFRTVEQDPRDLTAARKFLGVYLTGAREATEKFADYYMNRRDSGARDDFLALLDDLETNFASKTDRLLTDDRTGLDIEVEVLRERLARESLLTENRTDP